MKRRSFLGRLAAAFVAGAALPHAVERGPGEAEAGPGPEAPPGEIVRFAGRFELGEEALAVRARCAADEAYAAELQAILRRQLDELRRELWGRYL